MCQQHYEAVDPLPKAQPDEELLEPMMDIKEPSPVGIEDENEELEAPSVKASATLANHNRIVYLFLKALQRPLAQWKYVDGTPDQFQGPAFKDSVVYQHAIERSPMQPTGLKRTFDDLESTDPERPGPSKRLRSRTNDSEIKSWEDEDEDEDETYDEVGA